MITQRTHLIALRAAAKVTAVSRIVRRAAVGAVVSAALAMGPAACTDDSQSGTMATGGGDAVTTVGGGGTSAPSADVASLLDAILGSDASEPPAGVDATVAEDAGSMDAATPPTDVADEDSGVPDEDALAETEAPDGAGADPDAALPAHCFVFNGTACATPDDCVDESNPGLVCYEGECAAQDYNSEEAAACCARQYDAGVFDTPGCTPWGPPAPPADRGHRLAPPQAAA